MELPTLFEFCARTVIYGLREELALQNSTLLDWYWSIPDLILETYIDHRLSAHDTRLWDLLFNQTNNNRIITEQELQQAEKETREDDYNYDEDYYKSCYYDIDDEAAEWPAKVEDEDPDWWPY